MKPSEVLSAAKGLIDAPEKWIKGKNWGVYNGQICRCSLGALASANGEKTLQIERSNVYLAMVVGEHIALWNDSPQTGHEDVMAAFDRAIALAQEAGE